jgi:hypothetical protein
MHTWIHIIPNCYYFFFLVITFFPHELPACVILPSRTTTSTKREHQTTIFTHFVPFRQSNSCKDLNALTQFQKWPKYPHLKKKWRKRGGSSHPEPPLGVACRPPGHLRGGCRHPFSFKFFFLKNININFNIFY